MNIALIGLGVMGKNHYTELKKRDINLFLHDVIKPNWLDNYDNFFISIDELLKNKIDGVIIATPTKFHFEIFKKIYKNIKNILIEKPLSFDMKEAYSIKELAKDNNVCVGFCERFNPVSLMFKKLIADENILSANFIRVSPKPERINDVGVDLDLSVHDIDLASFFGLKNKFDIFKKNFPCTTIKLHSDNIEILASWDFNIKIRRALINTNVNTYELDFLNCKILKNNENIDIIKHSSLYIEHEEFINLIKTNDFNNLATIDDAIYTQEILIN
ncbi:Gfo/Idh/MocA family protein [Campylobacter sp. MG1]|uniref:Gfo/Idh/MocA family protein n=1 Tax=Campylobacter sp. MG1 TaxID=2976332 RepID=UPI00226D26BE|nr:Gfo/Idh/MocA family oxidoreductase [Campylobacter sp. MG1]